MDSASLSEAVTCAGNQISLLLENLKIIDKLIPYKQALLLTHNNMNKVV